MFVVTEFLHGFQKIIWSTARSVKIKLYVNSYVNKSSMWHPRCQGLRRIIYKKTDEWYIEHQWVTQSGTTSDNEWQRVTNRVTNEWRGVTTSNNEWQQVITSDNEWQRMAGSGKTNENEWERIKQRDFKFHSETEGQSGSWRILLDFFCNI